MFYENDPTWKPYREALARGEKCEIDRKFYHYWLELVPPRFYNRVVVLVDGTSRRVDFGYGEGSDQICAYWQEGVGDHERFFSQMVRKS